ncbi:MAG: hypothetical protein CSYNP_02702 [Syntrophus sp. SKADARSKE-3]|nr:hypothetical protein [Syntrophus sp. SKADARSKE-3]
MKTEVPVQEFGDYTVRLMQEHDVQGVVSLYRAIYGNHYPIRKMYEPEYILQQQESGLMYRVVISDTSGKVVAQEALYRLAETYQGLYEMGQVMILPEYRGSGLNGILMSYMTKVLVPALGIEEIWGEAVTNHVFMLKTGIKFGVKETGIELDLMPAESYKTEKSALGRVSASVGHLLFQDNPHSVYLPAPYADVLKSVYEYANRKRCFEMDAQPLPEGVETRYATTFIASAGVLRITILEAGRDIEELIAGMTKKYTAEGIVVLHMFIPLNKAWCGALCDVLNRQGFFYSALMPRWFGSDGLLLQRLEQATDYSGIQLYSDFSKQLLEFIIKDRARVEALSKSS